MRTLLPLLVAVLAVLGLTTPAHAAEAAQPPCGDTASYDTVPLSGLPPEAADTAGLIGRGGPFPYAEDGTVYQNREQVLPVCAAGHYRLYTVPTPGTADRGDRRLVTGAGGERYYTPDRYATFVEVITD